jgi:hypothetical protein
VHPCDIVKVMFKGATQHAIPNQGWWNKGRFKVEGVPLGSKGEQFAIYTERQAAFDSVQCTENYEIIRPGNAYDIGKEPWPKKDPCTTRP